MNANSTMKHIPHFDDGPLLSNGLLSSCSPIAVTEENPAQNQLEVEFLKRYGHSPEFYIQAPGRVNLIGEHIDYAGYGVMPMAISRSVIIAVSTSSESSNNFSSSNVQHMDQDSFPDGRFPLDPNEPVLKQKSDKHKWHHYVHCGYKGAWLLHQPSPSTIASPPFTPIINDANISRNCSTSNSSGVEEKQKIQGCKMNMLLCGNIPLAAGLSSSSALVVASNVAALVARTKTSRERGGMEKYDGSLEELANLAAKSEGFIGTMSGGMDQASSVLGLARLVNFNPVRTVQVPLPPNAVFVIANSLTSAEKAVSAHVCYNKRVVEMILASKCLATHLGLGDVLMYKTFKQVQDSYSQKLGRSVGLTEMAETVKTYLEPGGYTVDVIASILAPHPLSSWFPHASVEELGQIEAVRCEADSYQLQERALHVYTEAARVIDFQKACIEIESHDELMVILGRLMDSSHVSCDQLYDCSCPELNALTKRCKELGAFGSRLTGAGWGGSTVSLVERDQLDSFIHGLRTSYYKEHSIIENNYDEVCFAAVPSPGVCIYNSSH